MHICCAHTWNNPPHEHHITVCRIYAVQVFYPLKSSRSLMVSHLLGLELFFCYFSWRLCFTFYFQLLEQWMCTKKTRTSKNFIVFHLFGFKLVTRSNIKLKTSLKFVFFFVISHARLHACNFHSYPLDMIGMTPTKPEHCSHLIPVIRWVCRIVCNWP